MKKLLLCFVVVILTGFVAGTSSAADDETYQRFQSALKVYDSCLTERLSKLISSCEPAENIATAVLNGCPQAKTDLVSASVWAFSAGNVLKIIRTIDEKRQEWVVTKVVEQRMERNNQCD